MAVQTVGMAVEFRDAFTNPARAFMSTWRSAQETVKGWGQELTIAQEKFYMRTRNAFKTLGTQLIAAAAEFYTIDRYVNSVTTAYNDQFLAINRLDDATRSWGRNTMAAHEMVMRLAAGGQTSMAVAATMAGDLIRRGFSTEASEQLIKGVQDIVAASLKPGQKLNPTVAAIISAIGQGNVGALNEFIKGTPIEQRMRLAGVPAEWLNAPFQFQRAAAQRALLHALAGDISQEQGAAARYFQSLQGQQEILENSFIQARVALGEALMPMLIKVLEVLTQLTTAFTRFAEQHPLLVRLALIAAIVIASFTALSAIVSVLSLGFFLFGGALLPIIGYILLIAAGGLIMAEILTVGLNLITGAVLRLAQAFVFLYDLMVSRSPAKAWKDSQDWFERTYGAVKVTPTLDYIFGTTPDNAEAPAMAGIRQRRFAQAADMSKILGVSPDSLVAREGRGLTLSQQQYGEYIKLHPETIVQIADTINRRPSLVKLNIDGREVWATVQGYAANDDMNQSGRPTR